MRCADARALFACRTFNTPQLLGEGQFEVMAVVPVPIFRLCMPSWNIERAPGSSPEFGCLFWLRP